MSTPEHMIWLPIADMVARCNQAVVKDTIVRGCLKLMAEAAKKAEETTLQAKADAQMKAYADAVNQERVMFAQKAAEANRRADKAEKRAEGKEALEKRLREIEVTYDATKHWPLSSHLQRLRRAIKGETPEGVAHEEATSDGDAGDGYRRCTGEPEIDEGVAGGG